MASIVAVELEPEPAMTGTRSATRSTTKAQTASSSSSVIVELSPVVPRVRMPSVPWARWKSTRRPSASKSTDPSASNGVMSATIDPSRLRMSMCGYSFPEEWVPDRCRRAVSMTARPSAVASSVAK